MNRITNSATARLKQDYLRLKKDPIPYVVAEPVPSNILEWHYVVKGPEKTPYEGGFYHGKLIFPVEFPFQPPSIYMTTPNGRFKVNTRLCLSISDFHPDTWNPAWSVSTILTGLLSFMIENSPTMGSINTSDYEKKQFAAQSLEYNLKDKLFCELFPETVETIKAELEHRKELEKQARHQSTASEVSSLLRDQLQRDQSPLYNVLTNLVVIIGFAAFAFTVKYVLWSVATE
ncbi:ubiquitin-conjugating enzyme E2 J2-like [Apis laboriosa]|uniref:Ubiquitin-conjugating enzyme E2 J2 n=3 Tax=Apis TaxID=7459 RepID=A0A7M7R9G7_APIME|nr:ubiquitin-conjugating enzyme E2 J2 [Apis florea]XP_006607346.1 ubiquitin-conjugating enzyme E2 J2-like [Apis dorsata]XP_016921212.1 ubiquitin-conjugating enzyme E2 J2 [Apis cerana]XP_043786112.1 ubiquitin-conjugating enzyme E2 J2-like [Apis laboriosa]XP_396699.1 ubiquitin-conjugating enzyme E2 J2 [Apis mellifera]KAG6803125.1 ubiquitin-conjugating enzyme E2 J2 [Apis mellifera caucasica]KAG9431709.1 ubiquitin-conjugating enzyme E2 J2 [Apis mellifera carnica]PBC33271.1 Ubiquitin-conjugating |eukprot:XP_396699.1 ubiquitin-conjugating enzyme E2 J2 [Apis mellifera]